MTHEDARGLWEALSAVELACTPQIAEQLKPFSRPITDCYECGVEAPTLRGKRDQTKDIAVAALFLKRSLNDLRAVWNLLLLGYTSQAGSVAAAAFENALITTCVAGKIDRANELLDSQTGDSPWSVTELCKMHVKQLHEGADESVKALSGKEFEIAWRELYAQYMWLCKIKHPTIPSALHDAFSVSLQAGEYIIMAAPDTRPEDLPNKVMILVVTINRIWSAIRSFTRAREIDAKNPKVIDWNERLDSVTKNLSEALEPVMKTPLAFSISSSRIWNEYRKLRQS